MRLKEIREVEEFSENRISIKERKDVVHRGRLP